MISRLVWSSLLLIGLAQAGSYGTISKGPGWIYSRMGNPHDVRTKTQFGIVFEGGGIDVDAAYQWMCSKAGNGDFLVVRSSGNGDYNPYIYGLCPSLNSVSTLLIYSRKGAEQPFVKQTILNAEALFLAGGDQSQYVDYFHNGPVAEAIDALAKKGTPIGGTSAGNAVLAQFAYTGATGSVTSKQALANPFSKLITLSDGFLNLSPLVADTITDDHFVTRNRMGRLVTFMARIIQDGSAPEVSAIANNENTAFLMEADGSGTVVGARAAYFLRSTGAPQICKAKTPLTFDNLSVYRIEAGGTFNVSNWTGTGGTAYTLSAVNGVLQSSQAGGKIY